MKIALFVLSFLACLVQPLSAQQTPPETGLASFYSDSFHGRQTASKEKYDKTQLTAAHKTLPFGTRVRVTRIDNKKSVQVRINDRGPFIKGRVIDLSRAAAEALDITKEAKPCTVALEVLELPKGEAAVTEPEVEEPVAKVDSPAANNGASAKTPAVANNTKSAPAGTTPRGNAPAVATPKGTEKPDGAAAPKTDSKKPETSAAGKVANTPVASGNPAADAAEKKAAAEAEKKLTADKKAAEKKAAEDAKKAAAEAEKKATAKGGEKVKSAIASDPKKEETKEPVSSKVEKGGLYKMQALKLEPKGFGVQVAGYSDYETVLDQLDALQRNFFKGGLVYVDDLNGKNFYKVILGPFNTKEEAISYANNYKKKYKSKDAFVVDLAQLAGKANAVETAPASTSLQVQGKEGSAAKSAPKAPKTDAKPAAQAQPAAKQPASKPEAKPAAKGGK